LKVVRNEIDRDRDFCIVFPVCFYDKEKTKEKVEKFIFLILK